MEATSKAMMTLKQGKFFKDGQLYPIEFGNNEQIKLLEKVQVLRTEGTLCRGHDDEDSHGEIETVEYGYTCVCGHRNMKRYTYEQNNELQSDKFTCKCNLKYSIEPCDFSEFFVIIKLTK